jgi:hypothetical protein
MLFTVALHLNHNVIGAAMLAALLFICIYAAKERSDERKRA